MVTRARVAIAGGSLGGLTAALLLRDLGMDVTVYERSPSELQQRGAGIGFLPASYRYLDERTAVDLDAISVTTGHIRYLARDGSVVHEQEHRYRFSSWNTVYRQLLAAFGSERYLLGREVSAFTQDERAVTVRFADGAVEMVDLLVCADGVGRDRAPTCCPTCAPATRATWRGGGWCPSARSRPRSATGWPMPSPTACTPTATSSCTRSRVTTARWHRASG